MPHLVIIDGVVGAGKSTLIANLCKQLNAVVIPEYIEETNGVEELKRYLNNKQQYAYDFQLYILDYYKSYITNESFKEKSRHVNFVIMERNPLRGITYFAKLDLLNGYISVDKYQHLYFTAMTLLNDIKHMYESSCAITSYNTTLMTQLELMTNGSTWYY